MSEVGESRQAKTEDEHVMDFRMEYEHSYGQKMRKIVCEYDCDRDIFIRKIIFNVVVTHCL